MADADPELVRAERDLYRRLLDLGAHDDVQAFLDEALALAAEATGAQRGYLALEPAGGGAAAVTTLACSDGDVDRIRRELSQGIVAEALRTGRTISTASALDDPRFKGLASVQAHRIQAVLCAPIGGAAPFGALYLQGRASPGPFPERERQIAEAFARHVAPLADRLRRAARDTGDDPTREHRARLKADGVVGRSKALAEALRTLAVAAQVDVPVLLVGESGTGKTELARCLHASSRRAAGPFVELNCAAIPETLLEAELFGAEKGAHSTATRRMPGKVAAAEGGTLFLDEVAELAQGAQAKLLQFLQSKQYYRLGDPSPQRADVRVVAATNADLEGAVAARRFREDLYYRLDVFRVRVPSLAERPEDVPLLAEHLAHAAGAAYGRALTVSRAAKAALASAEWPGNVRQLAAAVQRGAAFALDEKSDAIEAHHLFPERRPAANASAGAEALTWQEATRRFQRGLLEETLAACNGNVSEAARRLDLARSHLHELLRAHGVGRAKA
ncbi:MAG: sigma-54-dependent Fis family transcriptional regulator [Polyangiales bacterium]